MPELPQNHSGDVVLKLNFKRGDRRKDFHTVGKNSFFEGGGASGVLLWSRSDAWGLVLSMAWMGGNTSRRWVPDMTHDVTLEILKFGLYLSW